MQSLFERSGRMMKEFWWLWRQLAIQPFTTVDSPSWAWLSSSSSLPPSATFSFLNISTLLQKSLGVKPWDERRLGNQGHIEVDDRPCALTCSWCCHCTCVVLQGGKVPFGATCSWYFEHCRVLEVLLVAGNTGGKFWRRLCPGFPSEWARATPWCPHWPHCHARWYLDTTPQYLDQRC